MLDRKDVLTLAWKHIGEHTKHLKKLSSCTANPDGLIFHVFRNFRRMWPNVTNITLHKQADKSRRVWVQIHISVNVHYCELQPSFVTTWDAWSLGARAGETCQDEPVSFSSSCSPNKPKLVYNSALQPCRHGISDMHADSWIHVHTERVEVWYWFIKHGHANMSRRWERLAASAQETMFLKSWGVCLLLLLDLHALRCWSAEKTSYQRRVVTVTAPGTDWTLEGTAAAHVITFSPRFMVTLLLRIDILRVCLNCRYLSRTYE